MKPLVEMRDIAKNFGGVHALKGVDLDIHAGEVVALLGHNGAGKSVLVQILSGVFAPSRGTIRIEGREAYFASPADARAAHIETIYQTLALAENLDAAGNFFLGRELTNSLGFLRKKEMRDIAAEAIHRLNPNFSNVTTPVRHLSGGQRQAIAIARAVHFDARVLIMDEPAAALGPHETAQVGDLIRRLREQGLGILLVSHDLHEVFALADRVVVFRNGQRVGAARTSETNQDAVLQMMIAGIAEPSAEGAGA